MLKIHRLPIANFWLSNIKVPESTSATQAVRLTPSVTLQQAFARQMHWLPSPTTRKKSNTQAVFPLPCQQRLNCRLFWPIVLYRPVFCLPPTAAPPQHQHESLWLVPTHGPSLLTTLTFLNNGRSPYASNALSLLNKLALKLFLLSNFLQDIALML